MACDSLRLSSYECTVYVNKANSTGNTLLDSPWSQVDEAAFRGLQSSAKSGTGALIYQLVLSDGKLSLYGSQPEC